MSLDFLPTVITTLFFCIVLSYYVLLFVKKKEYPVEKTFRSISVIIPARNEARHIRDCISAVLHASFDGKKEIIVVDDGSTDKTASIVKQFSTVQLIRKKHTGKSDSLNVALKKAHGELIAIVDADSCISRNSLQELALVVGQKGFAASSCVIKVSNRKSIFGMWLHLEQLYNSLIRKLFSSVNANVVTPGPLGVYRKDALMSIGGFNTDGFSEDIDITIRLVRKGYRIGFCEHAVSETSMPSSIKGFLFQRFRFLRGMIHVMKRHLQMNTALIDLYTLPLFLFTLIQGVIMGAFTLYQIFSGYYTYFLSQGVWFNVAVAKFFFEWLSLLGFLKWTVGAFIGTVPLTAFTVIGILSTLLTYPLYVYAITRFDGKWDVWHAFALFFMFPFWLLIMTLTLFALPEYFRKKQPNIWEKYH